MFGQHPRLAIDAFLGLSPDTLSAKKQTEYARKLQERLHFAYRTAEKAAKLNQTSKRLQARHSCLTPGDKVLVKYIGLRGARKIADRWERNPYVVKSQPIPDIPVYEVIPENPRARKTRLLQRILLLPFSSVSPPVDRKKSSSSSPDEPPSQSVIGDIPPVGLPDPSSSDSDGGYDASASSCSQAGDEIDVVNTAISSTAYDGKYVLPMRRKQGQPRLKPRSVTTVSSSESPAKDSESSRPQRIRRQPQWMKSPEWVFAQPFTFTVDRKDFVYL